MAEGPGRLKALLPNGRDFVFFVGFIALGVGLWIERPSAALIVCGAILVWITRPRARKPEG